ncbi:hypothetical protein X777_16906 [Ooceraea biroi]|uniref:Uncharacterized protein n=1 Tax=Ooceraea biroi TaxID=2015173 RepID=A0A026WSE0_OOCBI|nr:hypothetical protein X777_16906 [Ooceraea biroi]
MQRQVAGSTNAFDCQSISFSWQLSCCQYDGFTSAVYSNEARKCLPICRGLIDFARQPGARDDVHEDVPKKILSEEQGEATPVRSAD